jgi:gamma-glutamylcyclotransferase
MGAGSFLPEYKFVYDGYSKKRQGAVGNISEAQGEVVWGGVFEISKSDLNRLDKNENFPSSYDRKELVVQTEDGINYKAIAYFRIGQPIGKPSAEYRQLIIQGALDCGLDQTYIERNL